MPLIKVRSDIAANAVATPLQGNQYEFLPFDALVEFAVLADAGDNITATVYSGSDVLQQNARADELAVASPILYPDHYSLQDVAMQGERLNVILQEAGGIASTFRVAVRITPL